MHNEASEMHLLHVSLDGTINYRNDMLKAFRRDGEKEFEEVIN